MIARTNRMTLLVIFTLLMGFIISSSTGCPADDDSADPFNWVDDDDSAE